MKHFPLSFYSNRTSVSVNEHRNTIFSKKNCSQMPLLKNIKLIRLPDFIIHVFIYIILLIKLNTMKNKKSLLSLRLRARVVYFIKMKNLLL